MDKLDKEIIELFRMFLLKNKATILAVLKETVAENARGAKGGGKY